MTDLFGRRARRQLTDAQQTNRLLSDRVDHLCDDNDLLRREVRELTLAWRTCQSQERRLQLGMAELEIELSKRRGKDKGA